MNLLVLLSGFVSVNFNEAENLLLFVKSAVFENADVSVNCDVAENFPLFEKEGEFEKWLDCVNKEELEKAVD